MNRTLVYWDFPAGPRTLLLRDIPRRVLLPRTLIVGLPRRSVESWAVYAYAVPDDAVISPDTPLGMFPLTCYEYGTKISMFSHFDEKGAVCLGTEAVPTNLADVPNAVWHSNNSALPAGVYNQLVYGRGNIVPDPPYYPWNRTIRNLFLHHTHIVPYSPELMNEKLKILTRDALAQ